MIGQIAVCHGMGVDPFVNLALEKYLLQAVQENQCILYLWQNQNTVVIGRNQNAWAECRVAALEADGGKLVRRLSGGGAVFHDLGNLNFTFLVPESQYDLDRQLEVIRQACLMAGIQTEKSGRNDLLAEGRKFSGNAFYHAGGKAYHHGTILIDVDGEKLQRYLSPPAAKLAAKGVSSIRSRVVNLKELAPELTCAQMKAYLIRAFGQVYGLEPEIMAAPEASALAETVAEFSSWEYRYGRQLTFSAQCSGQFPWGHLQIQLQVAGGVIEDLEVYSDAMDWSLPDRIRQGLVGCRFETEALTKAVDKLDWSSEVMELLRQAL